MATINLTIVEPGLLILPGTRYTISWEGKGRLKILWGEVELPEAGSLDEAKANISRHKDQLEKFGLVP